MPYHQLTHIERHNLHLSSVKEEAETAGMSVTEYLELVGELTTQEYFDSQLQDYGQD